MTRQEFSDGAANQPRDSDILLVGKALQSGIFLRFQVDRESGSL
jgi:hypothetical protein